ncbi:cell division cycle-associated protein 2 [Perognathus longimembris pacificus]|uniref:cell division cycle-associated protein 2 n=1 Tax=Perognathus longimembris pacificus TaxID=214514 RepID=UPI002018CC63|nr:cell division cycle-associated protein 2 [Perognathus longimembris pacificus]
MDPSAKDPEPCENTESAAVYDSENASFILGAGKLVTPQKNLAEATPNVCASDALKSPLNFSTVTVEQLGITPESFVKNSAGKSSPYLKKFRRRSAVGTRGSPETNNLIRFIAQQRNLKNAEKSPLERSCCSPFQGSPGPYRNVNCSLRERISAFRSAFHPIKENKKMAQCPELSEAEAGQEGLSENQQCRSSNNAAKRRRISSQSKSTNPFGTVEQKVGGAQMLTAGSPKLRASGAAAEGPEKSCDLGFTQSGFVFEESVSVPELTEASSELAVADLVEGDTVPLDMLIAGVSTRVRPNSASPVTPVLTDAPLPESFVLRSVLKKPSNLLPGSCQEHHPSLGHHGPHPGFVSSPSCCCEGQKADEDAREVLGLHTVRKNKRVTFMEDLSYEVFDQSLPPNISLRKGGTPVCQKDLHKTSPQPPEESPLPGQFLQPNFDDKEENLENIELLPVSFPDLSPNKSSPSEAVLGTETFISSNNLEKTSSHEVSRVTQASNRRKRSNVCNLENMETPKEKKRKSHETKCTNKTVPKKNQVGKGCRRKKGKGRRSTPKPLYGEREVASRKPLLSPIPELPEAGEATPSGAGSVRPDFGRTRPAEPPFLRADPGAGAARPSTLHESPAWPSPPPPREPPAFHAWSCLGAGGSARRRRERAGRLPCPHSPDPTLVRTRDSRPTLVRTRNPRPTLVRMRAAWLRRSHDERASGTGHACRVLTTRPPPHAGGCSPPRAREEGPALDAAARRRNLFPARPGPGAPKLPKLRRLCPDSAPPPRRTCEAGVGGQPSRVGAPEPPGGGRCPSPPSPAPRPQGPELAEDVSATREPGDSAAVTTGPRGQALAPGGEEPRGPRGAAEPAAGQPPSSRPRKPRGRPARPRPVHAETPESRGPKPSAETPESRGPQPSAETPESRGPQPSGETPESRGPKPSVETPESRGPQPSAETPESRGPKPSAETPESRGPKPSADAARLCHELAEAIEQTLRPAGAQPRVRRSTRLQGDPDSTGLVWVPAPRRRTVGPLDSGGPGARGLQDEEQPPAAVLAVPGVPAPVPRRRRRRSCAPTLAGGAPAAPEPTTGPRDAGEA